MDRPHYRAGICHAIAICLYAVTPAFAQEQTPVTNIAGPTATSTGSVTNSAVQVLNGPYMTNTFGSGVSCQGASLNVTPFVFSSGNYPWDPGAYGSHTMNPGISATLTMPLDGESQQLCKERAKATINRENAETAKAKLDFELVRLLRCGEAKQKGFFFHPQSPYAAVCADVVVKGTTELPVSLRSSGE